MVDNEPRRRHLGTGAAIKVFGAVGVLGGLALIVAGIVNIVHLHVRAGGITAIVMGLLFVLGGRYLWRVPGRPTIELTADGIVFHADVDPIMRLLTGKRTVTFRWMDIEAINVWPTRVGVTIRISMDAGPERGERMIPICYPSTGAAASAVIEMKRLSAGARPTKPTEWLGVGSREAERIDDRSGSPAADE